jgi:hypothetical protein
MEPNKPTSSLRDFSAPPIAAQAFEHASHPYDAKAHAKARYLNFPDDFIELELPASAAHAIAVLVYLGLPHGARPFPGDDHDDDDRPSPARRAWALERNRSLFTKLVVRPGEKFWWPRHAVSALVTLNEHAEVIGGLAPAVRVPGESLELHPSLADAAAADPFGVPALPSPTTPKAK